MNKYIVSTIAIVALVMASVSCHRDERHADERGLSVSINASQSLDIRDITLWIHDNNNDSNLVGEPRSYYSLESVASDLIDVPAGDYTVVAALNTKEYFTLGVIANSRIGIINMNNNNKSITAGESQTMIGSSRVVVEEGGYNICYVDIETPYITMSGEINNIPEDVQSVTLLVINVSDSVIPISTIFENTSMSTIAYFEKRVPVNESVYFPAIDFMPAPTGQALIFEVVFNFPNILDYQRYYFSTSPYTDEYFDGDIQLCPIAPEQGKSYLFRLNYDDMSAGYVDLGDSDNDTVIVDPWTPDGGNDGDLDGQFN